MITRTLHNTTTLPSNCYGRQGYYLDFDNPTIINGLYLLGNYLGYVYFADAIINIGLWANNNNISFSSIQNGLNDSYAKIYCDFPSNYYVYVARVDSNQSIIEMEQIDSAYIDGVNYNYLKVTYAGIVQAGNQLSSFDPSLIHLLIIPIDEQITDYFQDVSFFLDLKLTGTMDHNSVRIVQRPNKLEYKDEYFDYSGLIISATFKNPIMNTFNISMNSNLVRNQNTIEYSVTNNKLTNNDYYVLITIHDDVSFTIPLGLQHRSCHYGNVCNPAHKYDVFFPDKIPNNLPVVITLHGGGWETGFDQNGTLYYYQRNNYQNNVNFLKSCGAIVVSAEYRLLAFDGSEWNSSQITTGNVALNHYDMLQDIDDLITTIKSIFVNYINSNIYLMGYSSGGHLAMLYSYKCNPSIINHNIAGIISEAGPIDFYNLENYTVEKRNASALLYQTTDFGQIIPTNYALLNPVNTKLIYSEADALVTASQHVCNLYTTLGSQYCNCFIFGLNSGINHNSLENTYALCLNENEIAISFYNELRAFIQ